MTRYTPPTTDPWKGLRGVMAGTMILEVIVVILAFPIVWRLGGGLTWLSGGYLTVLLVLMILASGMQGRPWAAIVIREAAEATAQSWLRIDRSSVSRSVQSAKVPSTVSRGEPGT